MQGLAVLARAGRAQPVARSEAASIGPSRSSSARAGGCATRCPGARRHRLHRHRPDLRCLRHRDQDPHLPCRSPRDRAAQAACRSAAGDAGARTAPARCCAAPAAHGARRSRIWAVGSVLDGELACRRDSRTGACAAASIASARSWSPGRRTAPTPTPHRPPGSSSVPWRSLAPTCAAPWSERRARLEELLGDATGRGAREAGARGSAGVAGPPGCRWLRGHGRQARHGPLPLRASQQLVGEPQVTAARHRRRALAAA